MSKLIEEVVVVFNKEVAAGIFKLSLRTNKIAKSCIAGNFVNISLGLNKKFLLKRPFGVHNIEGDCLELLYRIRGKGTEELASLKEDDSLTMIGPLGNSFSLQKNKNILILGGGMGIAPLLFLEKTLSKHNQVVTLYAVKTKPELVDIKVANLSVHIDEQVGCFACDVLEQILIKNKVEYLYICGPEPLMERSYQIAKKMGIETEVSLEARMACGFGACVGCVVKTVNGLKKVCDEGPVFKAEEIWQ